MTNSGAYKKAANFNALCTDLNDEDYYPSDIYERTKSNPNFDLAIPCLPCSGSLDEYASQIGDEILTALDD